MMIPWSRAFLLALKAVVYSVLWVIVGSSLIVLGLTLMGVPLTPQGMWGAGKLAISGARALAGLALMVMGLFILAFGSLASVIKVSVDEAARLLYEQRAAGRGRQRD